MRAAAQARRPPGAVPEADPREPGAHGSSNGRQRGPDQARTAGSRELVDGRSRLDAPERRLRHALTPQPPSAAAADSEPIAGTVKRKSYPFVRIGPTSNATATAVSSRVTDRAGPGTIQSDASIRTSRTTITAPSTRVTLS